MTLQLIRPMVPEPDKWLPLIEESYHRGYFSNFGPLCRRFEDRACEFLGTNRRALAVCNATSGLDVVLKALGCSGKVLMPSFTFPATAHAVRNAGCEPVFLDVDERTMEMNADTVSGALDAIQNVSAVLHVRSFGFCRDLDALDAVCRANGVPLVVDSAGAFGGALDNGTRVGGQGTAEVFSLHATKPFGIGEGGLIVAESGLIDTCRRVANFGMVDDDVEHAGCNAKSPEILCAIGIAKFDGFDAELEQRSGTAGMYRAALPDDTGRPDRLAGIGSPPWQFFLAAVPDSIEAVEALREIGVVARAYYRPALHESRCFSACATYGGLPVSTRLARTLVALPVHGGVTTGDVDRIARCLVGD